MLETVPVDGCFVGQNHRKEGNSMREETRTRKLYQFDELSEAAQEKALEILSDVNFFDDWSEFTTDEFKDFLEVIGVADPIISFSGFASQGDGLSFTGIYSYAKGGRKEAAETHTGLYMKCRDEIRTIFNLQKKYFYKLEGKINRTSHHYSHKNTVTFDMYDRLEVKDFSAVEEELQEAFRGIMQEMYRMLEAEYDYLSSRDAIKESIDANGYEFTEEGVLA